MPKTEKGKKYFYKKNSKNFEFSQKFFAQSIGAIFAAFFPLTKTHDCLSRKKKLHKPQL